MLTLDRNILAGLPIETSNIYGAKPSLSQQVSGGIAGVSKIVDSLMGRGFTQEQTSKFLKDAFGDKITPEQISGYISDSEQMAQMAQDNLATPDDTGYDPSYGYDQN
jgi:hypothetical protein